MIGRMIAMKRLPALMLPVFLLTLLSLPATAENVTVDGGSVKKEVTLTVDTSSIVDVTITWDAFDYTFDGEKFTVTNETMPKITVKNNNSQNNVLVTPEYKQRTGISADDRAFALYFFEDASMSIARDGDIKDITITGADSTTFYAVPDGNPYKYGLGTNDPMEVGDVLIKIKLAP